MVPWNGLFVGPFGLCPRWGGLGIVLVTPHVFNSYEHGRSLAKFLHTQGGRIASSSAKGPGLREVIMYIRMRLGVRSLIFMAMAPNLSMKTHRGSPSSCLRLRRAIVVRSCRLLVSNCVVKVEVSVAKESMV